MSPLVAIAAVIGSSLCNGISTVQQKIGADDSGNITSLDFGFLLRLLKNPQYFFGIILELSGYGLSLVALQILPLFLVQSVLAASVVITAFGERLLLHKKLSHRTLYALGAVIGGLVLLSISAISGKALVGSSDVRLVITYLPIPLGLLGVALLYLRGKFAAIGLAAIGGILFGNTSTIGRILIYPRPLWHLATNLLVYSLVASALLGQYFFTVSLQRSSATSSNSVMISLQTLAPAFFGLVFLGDRIRPGFSLVLVLGGILILLGTTATAVDESPVATI